MISNGATIYIIEDDKDLLQVLKEILSEHYASVQAFEDPLSFMKTASDLKPGCIVSDVRMEGMTGFEVYESLKKKGIYMPTIFITGYADLEQCRRALKAGVYDFLEKPVKATVLIEVVQAAISSFEEVNARPKLTLDQLKEILTNREIEIVEQIALGFALKEISGHLNITHQSTSRHRVNALKKLRLKNDVYLVRALGHLFKNPE